MAQLHEIVADGESLVATQGWVKCGLCGLFYRREMPTDEWLAEYYARSYRAKDYPTLHDRAVQLNRADRILSYCDRLRILEVNHCLDYGCANGVLLEEARHKWGCRVMGVELNPHDREIARERGVEVVTSLAEIGIGYDLVFMAHVLEHLREPVEFLVELKKRTLPGCWLVLEMPHPKLHGAWAEFHMTAWPPDMFKAVFTYSGWEAKNVTSSEALGVFHAAAIRP
jgi:2-polyprenyl-3-methyl-5-hydroxy-6-metoxy-1,4-benzoquinol methylase